MWFDGRTTLTADVNQWPIVGHSGRSKHESIFISCGLFANFDHAAYSQAGQGGH